MCHTTLKAIYSHIPGQCNSAIIFYDCNALRISYLAEKVQRVLSDKGINAVFIPTDHTGRSIIDNIEQCLAQYIFNITPGTKMHTVAFAVLSRKTNNTNTIYSINNTQIEPVVGTGDSLPIKSPTVDEIIKCQIARHKKLNNDIPYRELWQGILNGLINGSIKSDANIFNPLYGKSCFKINGNIINFRNKKYTDLIGEKSGIWWESVVATAIYDKFNILPYWQVKWNWETKTDSDAFFSELDVVFPYNSRVVVVSCKTATDHLSLNAHLVKSEAQKRFGRFTLPFVAVPNEKNINRIIDGVGIITPSVLASNEKLKDCINDLISSLRTTVTKQR